jgi:hypothetical protein
MNIKINISKCAACLSARIMTGEGLKVAGNRNAINLFVYC